MFRLLLKAPLYSAGDLLMCNTLRTDPMVKGIYEVMSPLTYFVTELAWSEGVFSATETDCMILYEYSINTTGLCMCLYDPLTLSRLHVTLILMVTPDY